MKNYMVGYPIFAVAIQSSVPSLPIPQWLWTIAEMSASVWTSSTSVQTFGAIIHPNSEFWQKQTNAYAYNLGRCFVAVVDIEADRQADVWCPMPFWSGRRAGNKQSPDNAALQTKLLV